MPRLLPASLLATLLLSACGDGDSRSGIYAPWESERIEIGDTVLVRTIAGSVWGDTMVLAPIVAIGEFEGADPYLLGLPAAVDLDDEGRIYVADSQASEVRVFDASGQHLLNIGRRGEGPGEFTTPDDLRITSTGEVVVRDQEGARFSVFAPDGTFLRSWPLISGFRTSSGFHLSRDDRVHNPTLRNQGAAIGEWRRGLVRYSSATGEVLDTIDTPTTGYEEPLLEASNENSINRSPVPFTPREFWSLTPDGDPLFGLSDRLRWERWEPDGRVFAAERLDTQAAVVPGEAAANRDRVTRNLRNIDPSWRWQGTEIPASKPFFQEILSGRDGSVWLRRHLPAVEVENLDWTPESPEGTPRTLWREGWVYDVFDADGRYMGPVRFPDETVGFRKIRVTLEEVLIVVTHPIGHEQVVRYRLEPQIVNSD